MKKTKKALASLAIAGMVLSMAPASVFAADSNRIFGAGRVETAIAIANDGWTTSDSVIVVPADDANIVDALAAAPLAGQLNAPILVSYKGALDTKVKEEIVALKATKVYAIGALSADVVNELKGISGVTVTQLQGADRVDTAAKVAAQLTDVKGSFVVAYNGSADALSAASYAAANDYSIVIANPDGSVPAGATLGTKVYTVGGQVTVAGATALKGADRYATNNAVINGLEYSYDKVYVANGQTLVDALAGAPLAAQTDSPIVLADSVGVATGANDNLTSSSAVIALGGTGAVSDTVLGKVSYQTPATLAVESVKAISPIEIQVVFNQEIDEDTVVAANFELDKDPLTAADELDLEDDGQTVTITLDDALVNDVAYSFSVLEDGVANLEGEELADDYLTSFLFDDEDAPEVVSVKATAQEETNTVKVKFSEPVAGTGTYKVAGKGATVDATTKGTDELKLVTNEDLEAGETYTIVIVGEEDLSSDENAIEDPITLSFKVTEDTEGPEVVSVKAIGQQKVEVVFSEKINSATFTSNDITVIKGKVAYNNGDGDTVFTVTKDADDKSGKTYDITMVLDDEIFGEDDETAVVTLYINDSVEDQYGNEMEDEYSKAVTLTKDEDGPALESIKVAKDNDAFELTFSEDLGATIDKSKIVVTDEDGVRYAVNTAVIGDDADVLVVTLAGMATLDDGTYSIKVNKGAVEDVAGNDGVSSTKSVEVDEESDTDKPEVVSIENQMSGGVAVNNKFVVTFSEEVTPATALKVSNYLLDGAALPSDTDIYFVDEDMEVVNIDLPKGAIDGSEIEGTLTVKNVTDKAGNKIVTKSDDVAIKDNTAAILESADIVSNMLVLTFNEDIDELTVALNQFVIEGDDDELVGATGTVDVDGDKVIITISGGNWADIKDADEITVETAEGATVKDVNGYAVKAEVKVTVE